MGSDHRHIKAAIAAGSNLSTVRVAMVGQGLRQAYADTSDATLPDDIERLLKKLPDR